MMLGVDECAFPELKPMTGYNYGCRCLRCNVHRKRYDAKRPTTQRDWRRPPRVEAAKTPPKRSGPLPPPPPYLGPCRCPAPNPRFIPYFGGHECANCGLPIYERTTP
jgi:hypothetical protein